MPDKRLFFESPQDGVDGVLRDICLLSDFDWSKRLICVGGEERQDTFRLCESTAKCVF